MLNEQVTVTRLCAQQITHLTPCFILQSGVFFPDPFLSVSSAMSIVPYSLWQTIPNRPREVEVKSDKMTVLCAVRMRVAMHIGNLRHLWR